MQTDFFRLDILSPIHIGTGDQLDPMAYLMRPENDGAACHVLDTRSWAVDYAEDEELNRVFSGSNIPAMRGFIANAIDPDIYSRRKISVSELRLFRTYEQKLSDQRTTHQLLFSPQITSDDRVPLIPGSSLKGSLRTAVIDRLDREMNLGLKAARAKDQNGREYRDRLEQVFGKITDSAFKQLKVSDVSGFADSTQLVEPIEIRRKEGKPGTPKNMCEVIPSRLMRQEGQGSLYARIALGSPLSPGDHRLTLKTGQSWGWDELAALVTGYFRERFLEEKEKFYGLPNFKQARSAIEAIESAFGTVPGQMIMRVGHYSQIEFVTVRENQPFTRKGKQGTPMPYGTTRTLANGVHPFGWICLTPCSESEYRDGTAHLEASNRKATAAREEKRIRTQADKIQVREIALKAEAEARMKAEMEQKRQEELAALSPEERDVLLLEQGVLNETQIFDLFNRIDGLPASLQIRTAAALKSLWTAQQRWEKKDCSKKQWPKVEKLKTILGSAG